MCGWGLAGREKAARCARDARQDAGQREESTASSGAGVNKTNVELKVILLCPNVEGQGRRVSTGI